MTALRPALNLSLLILLLCLAAAVSTLAEDEASAPETDLVLLIAHKDPDDPNGAIRITLENRGDRPIAVIPPPDIFPGWSKDGWWWCQAFRFYLHAPDGSVGEYQSYSPPPPAAFPPPVADTLVLRPGQSIGALFTLTLPQAEPRPLELGFPSPSPVSFQGFGKIALATAPGTYKLRVTYDPGYYKGSIHENPDDLPHKLSPLIGYKLTSNALDFEIVAPEK